MVFRHFTWQQFLVAASVLSSIWYVLLYLVICKGSKRLPDEIQPLSHELDEELAEEQQDPDDEVMGKPVLPEGMSRVSMSDIRFADKQRERQQGLIPDVIEELKRIFHIIEREQGTKADFISLFALVKAKYAAIRGTPDEHALNEFIRENVLFPISDEELSNLWY